MQMANLPVFFKQRKLQFFPAWSYALPTTILRIPYSTAEALLWSLVVYWMMGLGNDAGRCVDLCLWL
jgi:hypothetical protein